MDGVERSLAQGANRFGSRYSWIAFDVVEDPGVALTVAIEAQSTASLQTVPFARVIAVPLRAGTAQRVDPAPEAFDGAEPGQLVLTGNPQTIIEVPIAASETATLVLASATLRRPSERVGRPHMWLEIGDAERLPATDVTTINDDPVPFFLGTVLQGAAFDRTVSLRAFGEDGGGATMRYPHIVTIDASQLRVVESAEGQTGTTGSSALVEADRLEPMTTGQGLILQGLSMANSSDQSDIAFAFEFDDEIQHQGEVFGQTSFGHVAASFVAVAETTPTAIVSKYQSPSGVTTLHHSFIAVLGL